MSTPPALSTRWGSAAATMPRDASTDVAMAWASESTLAALMTGSSISTAPSLSIARASDQAASGSSETAANSRRRTAPTSCCMSSAGTGESCLVAAAPAGAGPSVGALDIQEPSASVGRSKARDTSASTAAAFPRSVHCKTQRRSNRPCSVQSGSASTNCTSETAIRRVQGVRSQGLGSFIEASATASEASARDPRMCPCRARMPRAGTSSQARWLPRSPCARPVAAAMHRRSRATAAPYLALATLPSSMPSSTGSTGPRTRNTHRCGASSRQRSSAARPSARSSSLPSRDRSALQSPCWAASLAGHRTRSQESLSTSAKAWATLGGACTS
mmetsp:Transcript_91169/g.258135  ORF Transcript_91169/g.258135 Transcript_91169/m.258135 type:complete len:331 (-) Transcript_91169:205-1197(-)